jgi:hypothetical protein
MAPTHTLCHSCGCTSFSRAVDNPISLPAVLEPGLELDRAEEPFVLLPLQLVDLVAMLS